MGEHEDSVFSGPPMLNLHVWGTSHSLLRPWNFETDRAEGERVAVAIEHRAWPFSVDWSRWRPDSDWPVPPVPDGWDVAPGS